MPMTVEAFILAAVDNLDATLNQVRRHLAEDDSPTVHSRPGTSASIARFSSLVRRDRRDPGSSNRPARNGTRRAWIAWVAVCLIWGTTYLGIKVALETIPPFLMGGLRYVAAGLGAGRNPLAARTRTAGRLQPGRAWPCSASS